MYNFDDVCNLAARHFPPEVWWHLPVLALALSALAAVVHLLFRCFRSRRDKKIAFVMENVYDELWDSWSGTFRGHKLSPLAEIHLKASTFKGSSFQLIFKLRRGMIRLTQRAFLELWDVDSQVLHMSIY